MIEMVKRNEFDEAARQLAYPLRRASVDELCRGSENVLICFDTSAEAVEFWRPMAKVQRRRKHKCAK